MGQAPALVRVEAPAVGQDDPEPRVAVQHAPVDEPGHRDGGLDGVAQGVGEVVRLQAGPGPHVIRVQEERQAGCLACGEERLQPRVVQRTLACVGADLHRPHQRLPRQPLHLPGRPLRRLQRHGDHRREPAAPGAHEGDQRVVEEGSQVRRPIRRRVVEEEGRGDGQHPVVHPGLVHPAQDRLPGGEGGPHRVGVPLPVDEPALPRPLRHLDAHRLAVPLQGGHGFGRHGMGMDVDDHSASLPPHGFTGGNSRE